MMTNESGDDGTQKPIERPVESLHPLKQKWAFWHLDRDYLKDWNDCLKKIAVIESFEDFWELSSKVLSASALPYLNDYYFFKDGIKPKWEDPKNINGGRCVVSIGKEEGDHDKLWLDLMMLLMDEQFGNYGKFICGAAFNARKRANKFCLWTSDAKLDVMNNQIADIYSECLDLNPRYVYYKLHEESCVISEINANFRASCVISESQNEDGLTDEEKLKAEDELKTESPLQTETPFKTETPLHAEDQLKAETPLHAEDQLKTETPLHIETPLHTKDQLQTEAPLHTEDQLKDEKGSS